MTSGLGLMATWQGEHSSPSGIGGTLECGEGHITRCGSVNPNSHEYELAELGQDDTYESTMPSWQ